MPTPPIRSRLLPIRSDHGLRRQRGLPPSAPCLSSSPGDDFIPKSKRELELHDRVFSKLDTEMANSETIVSPGCLTRTPCTRSSAISASIAVAEIGRWQRYGASDGAEIGEPHAHRYRPAGAGFAPATACRSCPQDGAALAGELALRQASCQSPIELRLIARDGSS